MEMIKIVYVKHLLPLQSVLNAAARVSSRRRKYDHIYDVVRDQRHWLPIAERSEYKLCIYIMLSTMQSAYRRYHSTETTVLKIAPDILRAADRGDVTFLCLLNLSAAFNTVVHDILFDRLERHSVYVDWSFNG